jgi:hypothetical protein
MGGLSGRQQALQSKARPPSASFTSVGVKDGEIDIESEVEPPQSPHSLATVGGRGIGIDFEGAPSAQSSQTSDSDALRHEARNASDTPSLELSPPTSYEPLPHERTYGGGGGGGGGGDEPGPHPNERKEPHPKQGPRS